MNESDLMAIAFSVVAVAGAILGYWFGRLDQRDWLAEQYKIACWQRDEAMNQRKQLVAMIESHRQNVEQILSESK
jgi:hypothetical protein